MCIGMTFDICMQTMVWKKWKPSKIILPTPIGTSLVLVLELGATMKMQLNMVNHLIGLPSHIYLTYLSKLRNDQTKYAYKV
jgi:hypothetical protein